MLSTNLATADKETEPDLKQEIRYKFLASLIVISAGVLLVILR
ncbi:MAG: hypothetical protein ACYC21_10875 [Eubacteriales bacterium]